MLKNNENFREGWLCVHRQIKNHWIWKDPSYFKAWAGIILTVNYKHEKVNIQGELIDCNRGQSLLSLSGWAEVFGKEWTRQKVRTFFNLLITDQMITTEGLRKTTRLTVCNYDSYQDRQPTDNTANIKKTTRLKPYNPGSYKGEQHTNNPQNNHKQQVLLNNNTTTWKSDYDVYKKQCADAFKILSKDEDLKNKINVLYPLIDFDKSLAKSFLSYWSTEEGWEGKRKGKSEKINWKSTVLKTIHFNAINL